MQLVTQHWGGGRSGIKKLMIMWRLNKPFYITRKFIIFLKTAMGLPFLNKFIKSYHDILIKKGLLTPHYKSDSNTILIIDVSSIIFKYIMGVC